MDERDAVVLEVGKKFVALCQQGKSLEAVHTLFAPDVVTVEARSTPNMPAELKGIEAVVGKSTWFSANNTLHSEETIGPFPNGDRFAVIFRFDISQKASNKRYQFEEVALYTVKDGKITREEFFYTQS